MAKKEEPQAAPAVLDENKSTALLDKERRMEEEKAAERGETVKDEGRSFAVEGNDTSAYVGVSVEYMTYSSETEKPLRAEEGTAERYFEDKFTEDAAVAPKVQVQGEQTVGGGSAIPLVYPEVSGDVYKNVEVTEDKKADEKAETPVVDKNDPPQF